MTETDKDFQAAHEIGKIYNSFVDKTLLADFFLQSAGMFASESEAWLYLASQNEKLWLESRTGPSAPPAGLEAQAQKVFGEGKPVLAGELLLIPLIVRNTSIGVACFLKNPAAGSFGERDLMLLSDLAAQASSALKNILLFEQNLKMERLSAIGQTVSMVMHELKNIIQLARFSQEHLRLGIEKQNFKSLERGFGGMTKAMRQMEGLSYEMLSLTKDYRIDPQPFNLTELLEELRLDFQDKASHYGLEFSVNVEESLGEVEGENRSLYRCILNLVKNSIEACDKDHSWVKVAARSVSPTHYQITVEDNGKGMSGEVKAKLFQAFFSTKGEKGTGLGLLVIDRTLKAHRGRIEVESEEGKGTRFMITLPKRISPEEALEGSCGEDF